MKYANVYAMTRKWVVTRVIVALFILCVALASHCVKPEGMTLDVTSTLVNCNEVGSQLPHRSHIYN